MPTEFLSSLGFQQIVVVIVIYSSFPVHTILLLKNPSAHSLHEEAKANQGEAVSQ
jgi:hypothetical protein